MGHEAAKVAANDAVPGRALPLVKLRMAVSRLGPGYTEVTARNGAAWATLTVRLMCWAMSCQAVLVFAGLAIIRAILALTFSMVNLAMAS